MIINNFYLVRIPILPDEANAPLVVYANAVPAASVALEGFQPIGGRRSQVTQLFRLVQSDQLPQCGSLYIGR